MLQHYFVIALRNLLKNKGQTLISIIGLAVGLFCFALCSFLVRYWMNQDGAFENKDQIVEIAVVSGNNGRLQSGTPASLGPEIQGKQFSMVDRITVATYNDTENLSFEITDNKILPYEMQIIETDTNFIQVFNRQLAYGDLKHINSQPNTLLLSRSASNKIYGDKNPIGKKVIGNDQKAYTIGGVFEDFPKNNSISPYKPIEVLTLSVLNGFLEKREQGITGCNTYALLYPEYKASDLEQQLRKLKYAVSLFEKEPSPVKAYSLGQTKYLAAGMGMLYVFIFIIGLLIFLSALLNYFSFTTGNFYNRIKEFSIRKNIGEDKKHLFMLLYVESLLLLILTGIVALCLNELFVPGLQFSYYRIQVDFDHILLSRQIGEYLFLCIVLSAIICGSICLRLSRISLTEGIRFSRHRIRNVLLGIQYFIALFFLSGATVATFQTQAGSRQIFSSLSSDEKERIFFVRTDQSYLRPTYKVLLSKWKENSMIEDILEVDDRLPNTRINTYKWADGDQSTAGGVLYASANIGTFLNLKPLTGSLLLDENSVLINEAFMNTFKENPVNHFIQINNNPVKYKINGVTSSLTRFVDGSEYYALLAIGLLKGQGNCYVRIQQGKEKEGEAYLKQTVNEFLPESIQPEIYTLKEECEQIQITERMLRNIFSFFAAVCILITLLGIYAAISQDTERRRKEVAIRKINGASMKNILLIFTKLYLKLLLITTLFVFPIMWMMTNELLKSWAISFNYNNPFFWIGIFLILALFTGITIFVKILNTVRINPAEVITAE